MKSALVFPGQGAQYVGMGKELSESSDRAMELFQQANQLLDFDILKVMIDGSEEELKDTKVTQPALYLHSTINFFTKGQELDFQATAGHSLGEFSALVAAGVLSFEDGLKLVKERAFAMQEACESVPGTMAAVIGLEDDVVAETCGQIEEIVVAANYNCPGQLVISGSNAGIQKAVEVLKEKGARRALVLNVGGAFHSPLMAPAKERLEDAIKAVDFRPSEIAIYQNVDGIAHQDTDKIKQNLIAQLTSPVLWTQSMASMKNDGFTNFTEVGGNGKVISGLFRRFDRQLEMSSLA